MCKFVFTFCLSAFYDKEAMLMDPVDGPILASLLGTFPYCASFLALQINIKKYLKQLS